MDLNRLILNLEKTKYLFFHTRNYKVSSTNVVKCNNISIERCSEALFLGLYLESNLSWRCQIDHIKSKILPVVGVLSRLRHTGLNPTILKNIYFALIHSNITYLISVWGQCTKEKLQELEVIQRRALKLIFNMPYLEHTKTVYKSANILPVSVQVKFSSVIYIHKLNLNLINSDIPIIKNSQIHNYSTRSSNKIHTSTVHTTKHGLNASFNAAIKLYNELPSLFTNMSFNQFKKNVKSWYLQNYLNGTA
ncbi:uncharacterized protein LOC127751298 [Frankliniella occidentalis]|uniref:Uncharacterized protein LOC127751298 n=1 Tax=Frankliniella occidentalis TaxID=133901 RepID=A0A9C6XTD5_FRAOC|nr:uncharacterized protein LOC127751298 [Frankliniella occidentalis]